MYTTMYIVFLLAASNVSLISSSINSKVTLILDDQDNRFVSVVVIVKKGTPCMVIMHIDHSPSTKSGIKNFKDSYSMKLSSPRGDKPPIDLNCWWQQWRNYKGSWVVTNGGNFDVRPPGTERWLRPWVTIIFFSLSCSYWCRFSDKTL